MGHPRRSRRGRDRTGALAGVLGHRAGRPRLRAHRLRPPRPPAMGARLVPDPRPRGLRPSGADVPQLPGAHPLRAVRQPHLHRHRRALRPARGGPGRPARGHRARLHRPDLAPAPAPARGRRRPLHPGGGGRRVPPGRHLHRAGDPPVRRHHRLRRPHPLRRPDLPGRPRAGPGGGRHLRHRSAAGAGQDLPRARLPAHRPAQPRPRPARPGDQGPGPHRRRWRPGRRRPVHAPRLRLPPGGGAARPRPR